MFCPSGSVCEGLLQPRADRRAHLPPDLLSLCQLLAGNHHLRHGAPQTNDDVHWTLDIVQVDGGDGDFANKRTIFFIKSAGEDKTQLVPA